MNLDENALCWIAGLFEGKGYFGAGVPSQPNGPVMTIRMIDEDVISRLADILQRSYTLVRPTPSNKKTYYLVSIKGSPTAALMRALRPIMGKHRQNQIDRALANYVERPNMYINYAKLSEEKVRVIRQRLANGDMPTRIARDFSISYSTIKNIRSGRTWKHVNLVDESGVASDSSSIQEPMLRLDTDEKRFHWLVGLIEGKGSFLLGTPSTGSPTLRVVLPAEDIIARAAEIWGVRYQSRRSQSGYLTYAIYIEGQKAIELMRQLYPFMGKRRQAEISLIQNSLPAQ